MHGKDFPVDRLRSLFPALATHVDGNQLVFFDGPAGTQVPLSVAQAMSDSLLYKNANKGGVFHTSRESDADLQRAWQAMADFFGTKNPQEIVVGQNMTSLTYQLSRSLSKTWRQGDEIVLTQLDHDANISPWVQAAEEVGVHVNYVPFNHYDYGLELEALEGAISQRTRLVAVGCASNATGGVNPVKQIAAMAKQVGALSYLDAVHFGPHALIDVEDWGCDFVACSAYKFFGPHLGLLWGRHELLNSLPAYQVRPAPQTSLGRWMTGTQSHESIMGTMACIDYIAAIGASVQASQTTRRGQLNVAFQAIQAYEQNLSRRLLEGLQSIDGIKVYGVTELSNLHRRFPTFSITHDRLPVPQLAKELADRQIQVWSGNYYALQFTEQLGLEPDGMVRIGLVHYNTAQEIDRLLNEIANIVERAAISQAH
ncbi:MAG TPA: cysteine desulfurase-like protein [Pirellulaceae bacterium]|nr:cysteine desulfurase-like protein [Pirellulaceae bacterium]HMO92541.1 cysteine desulfurase-like protein [Pirellulaceae bacterium]HMP68977.1 cysteine desulfurase-like protein [Pirellulaceae bacterium]